MIFFNFKTKKFSDMSNATLISQSIVLVDKTTKLIKAAKGQPGQNFQLQNQFSQLANFLLLKGIIGKDGFAVPQNNPVIQEFIFGDFVINHNAFPPKLTIKHNTSDKKSDKIKNVVKKIIETGSLDSVVEGVGINYELSYDNSGNQIVLKDLVCQSRVSSVFDSVNIKLEKVLNPSTKLTLTVADSIIEGKKSVYIKANFHNDVTVTNTLDEILKLNFLSQLEERIETVFENNDK